MTEPQNAPQAITLDGLELMIPPEHPAFTRMLASEKRSEWVPVYLQHGDRAPFLWLAPMAGQSADLRRRCAEAAFTYWMRTAIRLAYTAWHEHPHLDVRAIYQFNEYLYAMDWLKWGGLLK